MYRVNWAILIGHNEVLRAYKQTGESLGYSNIADVFADVFGELMNKNAEFVPETTMSCQSVLFHF